MRILGFRLTAPAIIVSLALSGQAIQDGSPRR